MFKTRVVNRVSQVLQSTIPDRVIREQQGSQSAVLGQTLCDVTCAFLAQVALIHREELQPSITSDELSEDPEPPPFELVPIGHELPQAGVLREHLKQVVRALARQLTVRQVQVLQGRDLGQCGRYLTYPPTSNMVVAEV